MFEHCPEGGDVREQPFSVSKKKTSCTYAVLHTLTTKSSGNKPALMAAFHHGVNNEILTEMACHNTNKSSTTANKLLMLCSGEHSAPMHHPVVLQLHCWGQEESSKSGKCDTLHYRVRAATYIYASRPKRRASNIINEENHLGHRHFVALPSGKSFRTIKAHTNTQTD